jgi:hypothetical protein
MHDTGKVVVGIAVFVGVVAFPVWFQAGKAAPQPTLQVEKSRPCILPKEQMRGGHMQLLETWRQTVVRTGARYYTRPDGTKVEMSLVRTCLGCHADTKAFCDKCHNYAAVTLTCFNCHVDPTQKEGK